MAVNKEKELLKEKLRQRFIERKKDVEFELNRKVTLENHVLDTCPKNLLDIANKVVKLQDEHVSFRRNNLTEQETWKLKDFAKREHIPFKDTFSKLVSNPNFVNYDVIDARHILLLLEEFNKAYETSKDNFEAFPLNLLSGESRRYLKNTSRGLSISEKLEIFVSVYRNDIANFKVDEYNYDALPQSRKVLTKEDVKVINEDLARFAKDDNIDSIFSAKNEKYFKGLCHMLKLRGLTFDEYIKTHTDYKYTECYKVDVLKAVIEMVNAYHSRRGTTLGITDNDPYLRSKIEVAQDILKVHTVKELFDKLKIINDNDIIFKDELGYKEIDEREKIFKEDLENLYPDKVVPVKFTRDHERLYDEVSFLANRRNFDDINDYLESIGFTRQEKRANPCERVIYLSKYDLYFYKFIKDVDSQEKKDKKFEEDRISLLDPYDYLGVYRKLATEKKDFRTYQLDSQIPSYCKYNKK